MTSAQKRLMLDLRAMASESTLIAGPRNDNLMVWDATIPGPEETPWEGGLFSLELNFGEDYPNAPPKVRFLTPGVFHPNVYVSGDICLDILRNNWSPTYDVRALLLSIQSLLADPNPMSAANPEAADLVRTNRTAYETRIKNLVLSTLDALEESA